jgi:cytochrome c-type biogenesis protein CcmE
MRRRTRLLVLLAVGLAGAGIAAAGVLPEGFASVSEVAGQPDRYAGHEVHVKAVVAPGSLERGSPLRFVLTDGARALPVEFHGSVPEGFAAGRTVVVSGDLALRPSGPVLLARDIQGGCASKYAPAPEATA